MQLSSQYDDEYGFEETKPQEYTTTEERKYTKWYKPGDVDDTETKDEGLHIYNCDIAIRNVLETGHWGDAVRNCNFLLRHWKDCQNIASDSDEEVKQEMMERLEEKKEEIEVKFEEVLDIAASHISSVKSAARGTNLAGYAKDKQFEKFCKVIELIKEREEWQKERFTDLNTGNKDEEKSVTPVAERPLEIKKNMTPSYYEKKYRFLSDENNGVNSPKGLAYLMYERINAMFIANRSSMAPPPQHLIAMAHSLKYARAIDIPNKSPLAARLQELEELEKKGKKVDKDELEKQRVLVADEKALVLPQVKDVVNTLFSDLLRLCQNPGKNYQLCLNAEHAVLNVACDILKEDMKFRHAVKLSEMILKVVCKRSLSVHTALEKRYSKLSLTVEEMWDRAKTGGDAETFLCYLYYVAQRDVRECQRLLQEEFISGKVRLFGNHTDMELPSNSPVEVKIAYNRLMVQMAFSFFRQGDISAATELVKALCHGRQDNEINFMLGQQVPIVRWDKNLAPRVTAFFTHYTIVPHCQINTSHLDIIYRICCVMESPWGEENAVSPFEQYNKVNGPPVDDKERVRALNTAIEEADAKSAVEHIRSIKVWGDASSFLPSVEQRAREACLRMFLYTKGIEFEKITVDYLKGRFGMDFPSIRRIVNETLLEKDSPLIAFWDSTETMIQFERGNVSRLARTVTEATKEISLLNLPLPDHERRYFRGPSKPYNNNYRRKQQ